MPTFATLNKFLDQDTIPPKNLQRDMVDVMKKLTEIVTTNKLRIGFSNIQHKVAPVEFVYISRSPLFSLGPHHADRERAATMLFMLIQVCDSIVEMAQHIHDMRVYIRKEEVDIRSNNKVCAKLWRFIDSVINEYDEEFQSSPKEKTTKPRKSVRDSDHDYMPPKPQKRVRISEK